MNPALAKNPNVALSKSGVKPFVVKPVKELHGQIHLPGDKSIAHRAIILSALVYGKTRIDNFPPNDDCLETISVFRKLGIKITKGNNIFVFGKGLTGFNKPKGPIFINESGTTLRLLLGVLSGQNFKTQIKAGKVLSRRPMARVTRPLRSMGALIRGKAGKWESGQMEEYPPIMVKGGVLKGITYELPVASAQVKSALLLAGLFAKEETKVIEPVKTRDHTERMLAVFKAAIKVKGNTITINGSRKLSSPGSIYVPGDISSAAFFLVAASFLPNSRIILKNVGLNPSRVGIIKVLKRMKANIKIRNYRSNGEPVADIEVKGSRLYATRIAKNEIPSLIDELPVLMVASSLAKGRTVIEGAQELRVKETDRINSMIENLVKMGAKITSSRKDVQENIAIEGVGCLQGANLKSYGDHRTAMSMIVAGIAAKGNSKIDDISCISKSFPGFIKSLNALKSKI